MVDAARSLRSIAIRHSDCPGLRVELFMVRVVFGFGLRGEGLGFRVKG